MNSVHGSSQKLFFVWSWTPTLLTCSSNFGLSLEPTMRTLRLKKQNKGLQSAAKVSTDAALVCHGLVISFLTD